MSALTGSASRGLGEILEEVPLAPRTTLGVGGNARYWTRCRDEAELIAALRFARERKLPLVVLGGGSNLLVADQGFDGLVVEWAPDEIELYRRGEEEAVVVAGAGGVWDDLVARAVEEDLAGIECLSGIPGRVGAAPIQNIGAYGQEISQCALAVEVVDLETGTSARLTAADCDFGYRYSRFKGPWRDRYLVSRLFLSLQPGGAGTVRYGDLVKRFGASDGGRRGGGGPSVAEVRDAVLEIRRSKSMVWDPQDPNHRSAGSFFLNPVVSPRVADRVEALTRGEGSRSMPRYPALATRTPDAGGAAAVKLSAAWLLEAAGCRRGETLGAAGLSTQHVLAVINRGGARAEDIIHLAAKMRRRVWDAFAIALEPEPRFLGFDAAAPFVLDRAADPRAASSANTEKI
ncbi:MAG: UDP-N-acetylmuramate dehydrogenase [Acidobacteriota bacterium]